MFEGKLLRTAAGHPLESNGRRAGNLRPVSWQDLVAKFDEARELRGELGLGETDGGGASFDPDSARHIAEIGDGKPDINLEDLADGKFARGMGRNTKNGAASDDPRKE